MHGKQNIKILYFLLYFYVRSDDSLFGLKHEALFTETC